MAKKNVAVAILDAGLDGVKKIFISLILIAFLIAAVVLSAVTLIASAVTS